MTESLIPAGWQWRMKNPASDHWGEWRDGRANFGPDVGFQWRERQVYALVFADTNPEARFIADAENSCPHCGGSGHKDDIQPPQDHVEGDNQPRYTSKRMRDEIAKATAYGLELAASYHDDLAAQHAASHANIVSDHQEMMERQHQRDSAAIRALTATAVTQDPLSSKNDGSSEANPPQNHSVDLEEQVAFTLSDASRLLRKKDVQGACPHPDDCFYESDRVRCGPCAVKASATKGVEINDTHSHLPEVCRLRREVKVAAARIAELEATPSPAPNVSGRPDGHCADDAAWEEFSKSYGDRTRADLCSGNMTDFALANAQFMCDRNSLELIVCQTAAKERIRWLSIQLAAALAAQASEGGR